MADSPTTVKEFVQSWFDECNIVIGPMGMASPCFVVDREYVTRPSTTFKGKGYTVAKLIKLMCVSKKERRRVAKKKLYALHLCDNDKCINPEHMYFGTSKDNTLDSMVRGKTGMQKFSVDRMRQIKNAMVEMSDREIADEFGISVSHACNIRAGRRWGDI